MKRASIKITPEQLAELLASRLDATFSEWENRGAYYDFDSDVVLLSIIAPELPEVAEGAYAPRIDLDRIGGSVEDILAGWL